MIEVKYEEYGQAGQPDQPALKLPKNIRQVGQIQGSRKIYVEDYVVTYLRQLGAREDGIPQAAVLLGHVEQEAGTYYMFASGAVETNKIEIDYEGIHFTDDAWTDIYEKIKQYFDDLEIIGWILITPGMSVTVNADIVNAHIKNFPGDSPDEAKFLMLMEVPEREESFYLMDQGELIRQSGYYIYFEKNAAMQEYMISRSDNISIEATEKVSDRATVNFRRIVQDREEDRHQKKMMNFMYAASSVLVMIVLVIGITMVNNYDQMKVMEESLQTISQSVTGESEDDEAKSVSGIPVESVPADVIREDDEADSEEQKKEETARDESEETDTVSAAGASAETYVVQKGDTLAGISTQLYGDKSKVAEICELNQIEDGDKIIVGQVLKLP